MSVYLSCSSNVTGFECFRETTPTLAYAQETAMAPAVISDPPKNSKRNTGPYKEVGTGPRTFNKERELKGGDGHKPASYPHYLPTWEVPEGGVYVSY